MSEYPNPATRDAIERYRVPTMGDTVRRYLVPAIGVGGVMALGTVLILLVILRAVPGMGMIFSPDTHANLWEEVKPGYNRTGLAPVAQPIDGAYPPHQTSGTLPQGLSQRELGQRLFSSAGCAMCHGLQGEGSVIAPPVAGASPLAIEAMVRFGPAGMPAFSKDVLPEGELAAITAYLQSLAPPIQETLPQGPSEGELGERLFSSAGCATCHGLQGKGSVMAPPVAGASAEFVKSMVRSGRGGMPAFPENALSEEELAAIIAYLQSLPVQKP